jgi:hypothetical protein
MGFTIPPEWLVLLVSAYAAWEARRQRQLTEIAVQAPRSPSPFDRLRRAAPYIVLVFLVVLAWLPNALSWLKSPDIKVNIGQEEPFIIQGNLPEKAEWIRIGVVNNGTEKRNCEAFANTIILTSHGRSEQFLDGDMLPLTASLGGDGPRQRTADIFPNIQRFFDVWYVRDDDPMKPEIASPDAKSRFVNQFTVGDYFISGVVACSGVNSDTTITKFGMTIRYAGDPNEIFVAPTKP